MAAALTLSTGKTTSTDSSAGAAKEIAKSLLMEIEKIFLQFSATQIDVSKSEIPSFSIQQLTFHKAPFCFNFGDKIIKYEIVFLNNKKIYLNKKSFSLDGKLNDPKLVKLENNERMNEIALQQLGEECSLKRREVDRDIIRLGLEEGGLEKRQELIKKFALAETEICQKISDLKKKKIKNERKGRMLVGRILLEKLAAKKEHLFLFERSEDGSFAVKNVNLGKEMLVKISLDERKRFNLAQQVVANVMLFFKETLAHPIVAPASAAAATPVPVASASGGVTAAAKK
ncbi:MAG TPA: hypothetical protein VGM34_03925 [Chlamydiales bacterium]|jgi:hypothetical protein